MSITVTYKHKYYTAMEGEWQKCLDFATSQKAVHDKNETYLPIISSFVDYPEKYEDYKNRAPVVLYTKRAAMAMTGMATRKEPVLITPDNSKSRKLFEDVDADERTLSGYYSELIYRFLITGRGATLIDVPDASGQVLTILQAEALGVRPRFVYYPELDIINWRTTRVRNVNVLSMVVLRETVQDPDSNDEFAFLPVSRYRVLDLTTGKYRQRIFDKSGIQVGDEIIPKMNNRPLPYIPIVFHGGVTPISPPLNHIVDINKHHYMLGADEMWGLRMAALPTPYFFGKDPKDEDFPKETGPGKVIGCSEVDAKTGFREFTGAGLSSVAKKLEKFEDLIATMTVQMAMAKLNDSATGASIDYANNTATLAGVVDCLSWEMNMACKILAEWAGDNPDTVSCKLQKDFLPAGMDAAMLTALVNAYMKGGMSFETYYDNLKRGEVADPQRTAEQELEAIQSAPSPNVNPDTGMVDSGAVKPGDKSDDDEGKTKPGDKVE